MPFTLSAQDRAFREEVRSFLVAELPQELRDAGLACSGIYSDRPIADRWLKILARRGWSTPMWPIEHGGCGWTPLQNYIFDCELAEAGAPPISPNAIRMIGPIIIAFGTQEQKAQYLPAIRSGDDYWAQGYSEPGAGSDLASLRCAAVRAGEHYIINGSKIWTTHAHVANRIFCLVRTHTGDRPQQGISFLVFDIDLPGIEVRPIISLSGDHELNEVFFTDVRVPATALIGRENDGWSVAKHLLLHERSHAWSPILCARLRRLQKRARPVRDGALHTAIAETEVLLGALVASELRMLSNSSPDATLSSAASSAMKIRGTELRQRLTELELDVDGPLAGSSNDYGHSDVRLEVADRSVRTYLNDRAASIYAGANEVQRNILAAQILRDANT